MCAKDQDHDAGLWRLAHQIICQLPESVTDAICVIDKARSMLENRQRETDAKPPMKLVR